MQRCAERLKRTKTIRADLQQGPKPDRDSLGMAHSGKESLLQINRSTEARANGIGKGNCLIKHEEVNNKKNKPR